MGLKDQRSLSTYNTSATETSQQTLLLLQQFKVKVLVSKKVLSLYSMTMDHFLYELQNLDMGRKASLKWLQHLRHKVENINMAFEKMKAKWVKKRKQIVLYLQKTVRCLETELMASFRSWISSDIVQWLQYMDDRIAFSEEAQKQLLYINGYNLAKVNDLSLQLMGVEEAEIRKLILGYIDSLLIKYGDRSPCSSCDTPHSAGCGMGMGVYVQQEEKEEKEEESDKNMCCICVSNEESLKYCDRCPVCRVKVSSIITVFKAGLQFSS